MSDREISTAAQDALKTFCAALSEIAFFSDWQKLPDRLRRRATRWSSELADALNHPAAWLAAPERTAGRPQQASIPITQRELLVRWLRSNGFASDAMELDSQLTLLLPRLREWEDRTRRVVERNEPEVARLLRTPELYDWIGREAADELHGVLDEVCRTLTYCRQLGTTLAHCKQLAATIDSNPTTKTPPPRQLESCRALRRRAEAYVKRNGFPGVRALARALACPGSSLKNAIDRSTYLAARRAEYKQDRSRKAREVPLTDVVLDNAIQDTEADSPETLSELIAEQTDDDHSPVAYCSGRIRQRS